VNATARDVLPVLYAACDGYVELRALPSKKQCFSVPNALAAPRAFLRRHQGENLYWGCATRRSGASGAEANCQHLGCLFADLDFKNISEAEVRERLQGMPLPPSIIIHSGGGAHAYWLLREPLDVQADNPRQWLQRLAAYLGADSSCAEPARVLRIPGTLNHKYTPARMVAVEHFDPEARYNLSEFDEWLPAQPKASEATRVSITTDGPIVDGRRNDTQYKLARSLKAKGIEPAAIRLSIESVNREQCRPPLPESEVAAIVQQSTTQGNRNDFTMTTTTTTTAAAPVLIRLSDVVAEDISWTWPGRLARGKKTLLAGDPGQGKSSIAYDAAARITTEAKWPDGGRAPLGNVLILCAEDGLADTVRPKIDRCGGDPSRVFVLDGVRDQDGRRMVNLARDLAAIEAAIAEVRPELVVIDPITAYLGKTDSYKDAEVRGVLAPLLAAINKAQCALMTVAHLSKDQQRAALHRPGGSIAFVAAARLAFAVGSDPNDEDRRIMAPLKSNISALAPSLAFRLPDGRVEWEADPVALDADALLRQTPTADEREEHVDGEAFLREFLIDGPQASTDVLKGAESNGISRRTLFRIKARIGVRAVRVGGLGAAGRWVWSLSMPTVPDRVPVLEHGTHSTGCAASTTFAGRRQLFLPVQGQQRSTAHHLAVLGYEGPAGGLMR
jgi:hypothetical protein